MVTVYSKANCSQCVLTIRKLDELNIPYEEVDILGSDDAMVTIKELGYLSAPVVMAMGEHWSGFRPDKISALAG